MVDECKKLLRAKDFQELTEKSTWKIEPGEKVSVNWECYLVVLLFLFNFFNFLFSFFLLFPFSFGPSVMRSPMVKCKN